MGNIDSIDAQEFSADFRIYHELMANKVGEILLVSSPYDAFILEEDGSLASRIINEYSGLNLSRPPLVTRMASASQALAAIACKKIDIVLTTPQLDGMDAFAFGIEVKKIRPELPVILLAHSLRGIYPAPANRDSSGIDKFYIWSGNSDLLLALVKNAEDRLNVGFDTRRAKVRVLLLVEDSPLYQSWFLPLIYKEVVCQTQAVLGEGLNEEHRLLKMRARPKILLAENYDEAISLYEQYKSYIFGIISDTRIPKDGHLEGDAGFRFLKQVREEISDLPLLLLSSESLNRAKAAQISAEFLDKNSPFLLKEIREFFLKRLGFGDFVFRMPDGRELDRAASLRELQDKLNRIPDESILYHANGNHFSNWIMGRSEIALASRFRKATTADFETVTQIRDYLATGIQTMRRLRQKGVVAQFKKETFDSAVMDFVKVGTGSIGGKARGLAFMAALLHQSHVSQQDYNGVTIRIPKTLVITTMGFEAFIADNGLRHLATEKVTDQEVTRQFLSARMPSWLQADLQAFLEQVDCPLSVRSSSMLEDAQFQPYAGLYETYMIPNNAADPDVRLEHLLKAVKLVYASTYYEGPRAFARSAPGKPQEEAMAVIVQELAGGAHGDFFYPTLSGVAQSHNFYPVARMQAEDGIAHIAMGLGKTVVEGERALRFCPACPDVLPQFSTVEDILKNSQRFFYALRIKDYPEKLAFDRDANLSKRDIDDAREELPVKLLAGTYIVNEHRIRETAAIQGPKVLTFARILQHGDLPLAAILRDLLALGRKGMGCPVEIEFSLNMGAGDETPREFYFLQMRPMAAGVESIDIEIGPEDRGQALCRSDQALGNGKYTHIRDILYIDPEAFDTGKTVQIAGEVGNFNAPLVSASRPYLLIGAGRWGSADRWLGIPVQWQDISGVGAMVEIRNKQLNVDPSQGSHFFQNITSLGIPYISVNENRDDTLDWERLR
ncbi:MAG: phosphoenolpyruvate synthase/pyruvate phosphate dikinase, partial [Desulfobacterales bacterium]|nr:phosphoenolpyruvate synthase/pyruvate phosphate dikinase [Desulfobacterales bacterium]